MTVEVVGLEELDQALAELPQALRRNVVLAALREAAAPIVKEARAKARRGKDPRRRGSKKQRRSGDSATIGAPTTRTGRPSPSAPTRSTGT